YRGAYCASKFAVEGLTDALRLELHGSNIFVSLIEPGPIESAFRANARALWDLHMDLDNSPYKEEYKNFRVNADRLKKDSAFTLGPDAVVKKLIHALENERPSVRYYVTFPTYLLGFLKRILPSKWMDAVMLRIAKQEIASAE
ncbi:MAG: short-chain dehydrogenase/reductase, partial [Gammaproteobacteria bacterium]|nr:short-chain dehydrogenase/reductase [Gammaproteobacteria bacterium]